MKGDTAKRAKAQEEYYWSHREEILSKQKAKRSSPEYKQKTHEYYQRNKERLNQSQRQRRQEGRKIERVQKSERLRQQALARFSKLNKKESCCFVCKRTVGLVIHHLDYDVPLLTVTLCGSCHQKIHKKSIELGYSTKTCPTCGTQSYELGQPIRHDIFP